MTASVLHQPHHQHHRGRTVVGIGSVRGSVFLWLFGALGWLTTWVALRRGGGVLLGIPSSTTTGSSTSSSHLQEQASLASVRRLEDGAQEVDRASPIRKADFVLAIFSPDTPAGAHKRAQMRKIYSVYEDGKVEETVSPPSRDPRAYENLRFAKAEVIFIIGVTDAERVGLVGDEYFILAEPGYDKIAVLTLEMSGLVDHIDLKYLIKSDDDTIVCLRRLLTKLLDVPEDRQEKVYAGVATYCGAYPDNPAVGMVFKDASSKWYDEKFVTHTMGSLSCYPVYMQGAMYVLGRQLVDYLHRNRKVLATFTNEDVTVGTWLLGVDRELVSLDHFLNPFSSLWGCKCALKKKIPVTAKRHGIFFHDCKSDEQLYSCRYALSLNGLAC